MTLSPDGVAYVRAAAGLRVPVPYSRRWLLPWLLGPRPRPWLVSTYLSLVLTPLFAWVYFGVCGLHDHERLFAALLLSALPGVWRCSLQFPVLVDAPSFAMALGVAALARGGHPILAALASLPLGATRESGPVFAALWSWSPWPLVGLLAVGWRRPSAPPDAPWLAHPIREAWALRRRIGLDGRLYLLPWGAALAGLTAPTPQMVATLLVAHAQLLVAQDAIRLTVWGAPVLVAAAAQAIPVAWWPLAILVTVMQSEERV